MDELELRVGAIEMALITLTAHLQPDVVQNAKQSIADQLNTSRCEHDRRRHLAAIRLLENAAAGQ